MKGPAVEVADILHAQGNRFTDRYHASFDFQQLKAFRAIQNCRLAAFAQFGMFNWLYEWHRPEGPTKQDELTEAYVNFFFRGLLGTSSSPATSGTNVLGWLCTASRKVCARKVWVPASTSSMGHWGGISGPRI